MDSGAGKSRLDRSKSVVCSMIHRVMEKNKVSAAVEDLRTFLPTTAIPAMNFEKQLDDLRCRLGGTAVFRCILSYGGRPTITWLKNSFPIQADERVFHSFDGKFARLVVAGVEPSDFGCYECVAVSAEQKCLTRGTLLLKDSLADCNNNDSAAVQRRVSETENIHSAVAEKLSPGGEQEEVKRSVLRRLEAARNRCSLLEKNSVEKAPMNGQERFRTTSFHESPALQSAVRLEARPLSNAVSLQRTATTVRQKLLEWCKIQLREYKGVNITNFSSSWNDGLAFCALIHRFVPDAFDFDKLDCHDTRHNFQLAFDMAEKHANVTPLLDVDDMVRMKNPDWKCIFMYVESIYRAFAVKKNSPKPD